MFQQPHWTESWAGARRVMESAGGDSKGVGKARVEEMRSMERRVVLRVGMVV